MWYSKEYNPMQAGAIDGTDIEPHDAAVQRAAISQYRPPQLKTDPHCTLFVGRLSFDTTETAIRSHFEKYGEIVDVKLIRNYVTGLSQGYGFITFASEKTAKEAYHEANKSVLDSHTILVDFERSRVMKNWIPRRLGGGFGGKKDSGQLRFGARDRPFREPSSSSRLRVSHDQKRSDCWTHSTSEKSRTRTRKRSRSRSRSRSNSVDRPRYHRQRREEHDHREERRSRRSHRSRSPSNDRYRGSSSRRSSRHHYRDSNRSPTRKTSHHR